MEFLLVTNDEGTHTKIEDDSSKQREKFSPSIWAYIRHSPMYDLIAGLFSYEKWLWNPKIYNDFNNPKSSNSNANWQCSTTKLHRWLCLNL